MSNNSNNVQESTELYLQENTGNAQVNSNRPPGRISGHLNGGLSNEPGQSHKLGTKCDLEVYLGKLRYTTPLQHFATYGNRKTTYIIAMTLYDNMQTMIQTKLLQE